MIALCNAQSKLKLFFTVKLVVISETESLSQRVELEIQISPIHEWIIQTLRIICVLDQPVHLQEPKGSKEWFIQNIPHATLVWL